MTPASAPAPALLCFDGSDDATAAIAAARSLLTTGDAVVLTVWEPVSVWAPFDPGAVLSAGVAKLGTEALGLDDIAEDMARETLERGLALARQAGFTAEGRIARGKPWRVICDVADELGAAAVVAGARGLGRVESMLLGSVSSAVVAHAERPVLVIPPHRSPAPG